ncbi:MAG: Hsp20/alpha crystallin family protein [Gammaproteobacteria bacterium]|nr:Hsp20/alpha crystallin family protein [Gammaproteobacteria bacterium]
MANEEKKESKQEVKKVETAQVLSPFEEMERMFDDYFSRGWFRPLRTEWPSFSRMTQPFEGKTPSVDVIERDDAVIVKAELPGVEKKDIDVSVTSNAVTIKGSSSHEEKEEKGDYYRCEISRGSYQRTLSLPADVDESKAKAKLKDGILQLTLPKVTKSKRKSIKVD